MQHTLFELKNRHGEIKDGRVQLTLEKMCSPKVARNTLSVKVYLPTAMIGSPSLEKIANANMSSVNSCPDVLDRVSSKLVYV